jgi:hypothetical protein
MKSPKRMVAALAVSYWVSLAAHADCVLPPPPSKIPDGKTASKEEMTTALETMKEYNSDVETYLKCLEFEAKQHHLSTSEEDSKHNSAVDTLQKIASKFNEQVRNFNKAKNG